VRLTVVAGAALAAVGVVVGGQLGAAGASVAPPPPSSSSYAHAVGAETLAGTGNPGFDGNDRVATEAELDAPAGIAEDASGDLFIADAGNCRVQEIPARTGRAFATFVHKADLVTVAGGSCRNRADPPPTALAVDRAGNLFVAYGSADRVEELPARSSSRLGTHLTAGRLVAVAGTGTPGFDGDGRAAPTSQLHDPTGVAVDGAGNLFISDTGNCRLRMVAATTGTRFATTMTAGHLYTVAGNGICGSSGDGGPSLQAELWDPGALATGPVGQVYIADQGNRTIRVLAPQAGTYFGVSLTAGELGTVAGAGSYGAYLADGLPALGGLSEINYPTGIALDRDGDLYLADGDMHVIRFVAASVTRLRNSPALANDMYSAAGAVSAGTLHDGTAWVQTRMIDPTGLAVTPGGRLVYSDTTADVVRELPAGG
jgi:trimeric autotransporter adhesin